MMNTRSFEFDRLVDGLTIEIRINEGHRQALRFQMIDHFETRQGQRWRHPSMKIAAVMAIGFGLVGIGLVVHQKPTTPAPAGVDAQNALDQLEVAAARGDLSALTEFLRVPNLPVQLAALRHLGLLGDARTLADLEAFLQTDPEPEVRSAAEQAVARIRQRLLRPRPQRPVGDPPPHAPVEVNDLSPARTPEQASVSASASDFRLIVVDDASGQPLEEVHVAYRWQGIFEHFNDLHTGTHILKASRGLELSGQVVDRDGAPILGATVAEGYDLRFGNGSVWHSDAQGCFVLARQQAGQKVLTVQAPGYAPDMAVLDLESDRHDLSFCLAPGHALRFEVMDAQGQALRGVAVETRAWRRIRLYRRAANLKREARTNAKGAATLVDLPADDVIVQITKKGYADLRHLQVRASDRKIEVVLHKMGEVHGRILNRETGAPVESARLIEGPHWPDRDGPVWQAHQAKHLGDSQFRHVFRVHDEGMALRVEAPGFLTEETEVFYNDGSVLERDILLTPGSPVSGVVLGTDGCPAEGVRLAVVHAQRPAILREGRLRMEPGDSLAQSDALGRFTLPAQRQTYWLVALGDQGMAELSEERFLVTREIRLQPWGRIEGMLWQGSRPAVSTPVTCSVTHTTRGHVPLHGSHETRTDDRGRFVFDRIRPGRIHLLDQTVLVKPGETTPFEGRLPSDDEEIGAGLR